MLEGMGEWTVAHVVQETRRLDEFSFVVREAEGSRHLSRDMAHPEAVFHAGMVRPRKHEIRQTELADRIQSLEFERFEKIEGQRIQANRPVNRVRNRLQIGPPTRPAVPASIASASPF